MKQFPVTVGCHITTGIQALLGCNVNILWFRGWGVGGVVLQLQELKRTKCTDKDIRNATGPLEAMVLAMAEVLVGHQENGKISPFHLFPEDTKIGKEKGISRDGSESSTSFRPGLSKKEELFNVRENIKKDGVFAPDLAETYKDATVMKIFLDLSKNTYVPDPFLLLVKAAITWSARCKQKLLPARGDNDELPSIIQFSTVV